MKLVINTCYGEFSFSEEAIDRLRALGENISRVCGDCNIPRHNQNLVSVVEELGPSASGEFARLRVVDVPGNKYRIVDHDGKEDVETPDDIPWITVD